MNYNTDLFWVGEASFRLFFEAIKVRPNLTYSLATRKRQVVVSFSSDNPPVIVEVMSGSFFFHGSAFKTLDKSNRLVI